MLARTNKPDTSEGSAKGNEHAERKPIEEDITLGAAHTPVRRRSGQRADNSEASPDDNYDAVDGVNGAAVDESGEEAEECEKIDVDPIEAMRGELTAERDKYLRLAAEYDNYRKRSSKEREMIYNNARADTIIRLLPIYDNLERALKSVCADEAFYKGVEMTMTQLTEILEGMGVVPILAVGEPFNPNRHNAVTTIEDPNLGDKIIAEEYQKGFMLGDQVIRFSTVVVAN